VCLYSHTLTIQVVEYLKTVLTEHDFACFTCAPVMDGLIDQVFATFSAVTSYACFVRHDVFTRHHYGASYLTYHHDHDPSITDYRIKASWIRVTVPTVVGYVFANGQLTYPTYSRRQKGEEG